MLSLLQADWLRIRRRWDVWIIVTGIPALALFGYFASAMSSGTNFVTSGDVPPEFQQQLNAQMAAQHAFEALPFQFPRSIATMVQGAATWLILGGALLTATMIGSEFTWGTIRNVALFRADRLRYLTARLVWLVGLLAVPLLAMVVLGASAPAFIRVDPGDPSALADPAVSGMFGPSGTATGPVNVVGALLVTGSFAAVVVIAIGLAGLATLKLGSASAGMLAAGIYVAAEGLVAAYLTATLAGPLRYIPQMAISMRIAALLQDAQVAAGLAVADTGQGHPSGWVSVPPLAGLAIVAVWMIGLFGLWFVVMRRADIDE